MLCELVNVLEDDRIEQAMSIAFPGAAPALTLLGDLVYRDLRGAESKPEFKAFQACLAWRWAHTRRPYPTSRSEVGGPLGASEREMLKRLNMLKDEAACAHWAKIKPLVEAAWNAPHTGEVIRLARDILALLGIPASLPPRRLKGVNTNGVPLKRGDDDPALPLPTGPEIDGPGLDGAPHETKEHHSGTGRSWTRPQPYLALEDAARPLAQRIVEVLHESRPNARPRADATAGRYVYRLEARDWERPFLKRADLGRAPRSLALHLLIDWSSSMRSSAGGVRLALMALHLAAAQLAIPHAITFFGAGRDAAPQERLETIASFHERGEWPKALIAGYEPSAGNEYLFAALDEAITQLRDRPERDLIVIACTDGQPVWSGREGRDWDLSLTRVAQAERQGITVIGLFLGEGEEDLRKMQRLFPRLIVTTPDRLPEKLGGMLISLA